MRTIRTWDDRDEPILGNGSRARKNLFFPPYESPSKSSPRRKTFVTTPEEGFTITNSNKQVGFSVSDIRTYLELYASLSWTFRGVQEIASSIAKLPFRITAPSENDEMRRDTIRRHPLRKLLRNPNPLHTTYELMTMTISYLLLAGSAYWFIERSEMGFPVKLHVPRPDRIEPKLSSSGSRSFLRRFGSDQTETWTHRDVVHFNLFNPLSEVWGLPHVKPGEDSAVVSIYHATSDKKFWRNAINPKFVLMAKGNEEMSDATFERLRLELEDIHQGVGEFHKVAVLENAELRELANEHHVSVDALRHRDAVRDENLGSLGCHHLVALFGGANRSTQEMAYRMFWEMTVLPLIENVQQTISKELLWQISFPLDRDLEEDDLDFEFDTRKERALKESAASQSLIDFRYGQIGAKTINEIRYDNGDPPIPDGERPARPPTRFSRTRHDRNDMRTQESEAQLENVNSLEQI